MAGIAALIARALNAERRAETPEILHSEDLLGQLRLRRPLPPSTGQFAENLEPFTGEHLGSDYQSSTAAAVVLDGLAHDG